MSPPFDDANNESIEILGPEPKLFYIPPLLPQMHSPTLSSISDADPPSPWSAFMGCPDTPYLPTVPSSDSGLPQKGHDAPLKPTWPQCGMAFATLGDVVHFVQEYECHQRYH